MSILLAAIVLGLIPAAIARSKKRSFLLWWLYGSALLIVALPHALLMHGAAPFEVEEANENPLPRLPKRGKFPVVGRMDIAAEILFRHGGPGTHEWHDVSLLAFTGEEENGWIYVREVAIRERPGLKGGFVDFKQILELRDTTSNSAFHSWEEMARYLREAVGGLNKGDADKRGDKPRDESRC